MTTIPLFSCQPWFTTWCLFFFLFFLFLFTFSSVLLFLQDLAKCSWSGLSINNHDVKGMFFWVCSKELYLKPISFVPQILKIWNITVNLPFHRIWEQSCNHRRVPVGSGRSAYSAPELPRLSPRITFKDSLRTGLSSSLWRLPAPPTSESWPAAPYHELPWWFSGQDSTCQCRRWGWSPGQEDPLEKQMAAQPCLLAWESQAWQRALAGYSPWSHRVKHSSETKQQRHSITRPIPAKHPFLRHSSTTPSLTPFSPLECYLRDFSGGPAVKTPHSQPRGPRFNSRSGN